MITKKELKEVNASFDMEYGINDKDVENANRYKRAIESKLERPTPQVGDLIEGAYYGGTCPYSNGLIEARKASDVFSVCYDPMVPFVTDDYGEDIGLSVSGGPFTKAHESMFELVGEDERWFCFFGHCGWIKNGSVYFKAKVKKWKLRDFYARYPWGTDMSECIVQKPRYVHNAEYRAYIVKDELFNVYLGEDKTLKTCCKYDGISIATSIQKLEDKISNNEIGDLRIIALKQIENELTDIRRVKWWDKVSMPKFVKARIGYLKKTKSPSLCFKFGEDETVFVNDYIGLRVMDTQN